MEHIACACLLCVCLLAETAFFSQAWSMGTAASNAASNASGCHCNSIAVPQLPYVGVYQLVVLHAQYTRGS